MLGQVRPSPRGRSRSVRSTNPLESLSAMKPGAGDAGSILLGLPRERVLEVWDRRTVAVLQQHPEGIVWIAWNERQRLMRRLAQLGRRCALQPLEILQALIGTKGLPLVRQHARHAEN